VHDITTTESVHDLAGFETALAEQLANLIAAPPDRVDAEVVSAQRVLCKLLEMDRSSIWQGSLEAPETLRLTHLCTLDEIPPVPEGITTNDAFPWFTAQLLAGKTVIVGDVTALPPEASVDRDTLSYYLDKSTLAIPFVRRPGEAAGAISFSATTRRKVWSDTVLVQCRLVAQAIDAVLGRKHADDAALAQSAKLRVLFDSSRTDLIWCVDAKRYGLVTWNRAYETYVLGLMGTAIQVGDTLETLFGAGTAGVERWRALYDRALKEGRVTTEYALDVGGVLLLLELNAVFEDGACTCISVFGRDVTRQTQQEADLQRVQRQLEQAQKMEEMGRLAAGVAHDFNNLLTVIQATTEFVRDKLGEHPLASELEAVTEAGNRASDLTRQLLAFSRRQPRQLRVVDLVQVVKDANKLLRRILRDDIQLSTELEGTEARVLADRSQLDQIIVNLAVNARDAMPRGGHLLIGVREREVDAEARAEWGALSPGPYVELRVSDSGEGIAPEHLNKVFEAFFTTKPHGSGLGLATVFQIVKDCGGDLRVESTLGQGTSVVVLLPRSSGPLAKNEQAEVPSRSRGGETLLVVDDDEQVLAVLARMLRSSGYEVLAAGRGDEALALANSRSGRLDLLITDVVMPGMSGPELARELRKTHPGIPVLFASGFSDIAAEELEVVSTVPILAKPYTRDAVMMAVSAALGAKASTAASR
jgi:signal transduction histidine kinase/CheY-like chemotaxis protein